MPNFLSNKGKRLNSPLNNNMQTKQVQQPLTKAFIILLLLYVNRNFKKLGEPPYPQATPIHLCSLLTYSATLMISTTDHPLEKRKIRCERAIHNYMSMVAKKESTAIRTLHRNKIIIKVKNNWPRKRLVL